MRPGANCCDADSPAGALTPPQNRRLRAAMASDVMLAILSDRMMRHASSACVIGQWPIAKFLRGCRIRKRAAAIHPDAASGGVFRVGPAAELINAGNGMVHVLLGRAALAMTYDWAGHIDWTVLADQLRCWDNRCCMSDNNDDRKRDRLPNG